MKWLLVTVAVLLVIAISVGVTLFFTRDGSGGNGTTSTSSTPTASDIASAGDTGPVTIITADPTCDGWRPLQNALAASQSEGWRQRDPTTPASEWTPDQRAQFEAAGNGMRATSDQALDLAKQTPHRVMRELYEQFVAYGRAYADSIESYVPADDFLSRANVSLSGAIAGICDAIAYGNVITRAASLPQASPPTHEFSVGDPANPQRFVTEATKACVSWITKSTALDGDLREWEGFDNKIPANQWTPEQRSVQENAARIFDQYATDIDQIGRGSGKAVFEDFATLASLYFRAYSMATPTYTVADDYIATPGLRIDNAVTSACKASVD